MPADHESVDGTWRSGENVLIEFEIAGDSGYDGVSGIDGGPSRVVSRNNSGTAPNPPLLSRLAAIWMPGLAPI